MFRKPFQCEEHNPILTEPILKPQFTIPQCCAKQLTVAFYINHKTAHCHSHWDKVQSSLRCKGKSQQYFGDFWCLSVQVLVDIHTNATCGPGPPIAAFSVKYLPAPLSDLLLRRPHAFPATLEDSRTLQ